MTACLRQTKTAAKQLKLILNACLIVLAVFFYSSANAQVTFTKILDNKVADPIGGNFSPDSTSPPAIDGTHIVFRSIGTGGPELWSSDLTGSTLTNLATTQSALPGLLNAGSLSNLAQSPAIARNGIVLFSASDHLCLTIALGDCGGIWSTPPTSSTYKLIANGGVLDLSSILDDFFFGLDAGGYSYALDDVKSKVAFEAHDSILGLIGGVHGVYLENLNGSSLSTIADNTGSFIVHPAGLDPITDFFDPAISNGVVAFVGKSADELAQGIYTFPATGTVLKDGSPAFTELLSSVGKLPGDPNSGDNLINIIVPSLELVGDQLFFVATNALSNPTYAGVFVVNTVTGAVTKIVSSADFLSGLNTLLPEFTYSVNSLGQLVFKATDGVNAGYYVGQLIDGAVQITKIVVSGQLITVSGQDVTMLVSDVLDLGKNALSDTSFVFQIISDAEEIVLTSIQTILATPTPTPTATSTPSSTPTATPTVISPTATATPSATSTGTASSTATGTATPTATTTRTATATATSTATASATATSTATATRTTTATATSTATASATATSTATGTATATATRTSTATATPTSTPTSSATAVSPTPTATATATQSPTPTPTITATPTPEPTAVPVKLLVRPKKVNFGSAPIEAQTLSRIITVTNHTKRKRPIPVTLENVRVTGPFVITSDLCSGVILPIRGSSCQVTVALKPAAVGKAKGVLFVTDNARKDPQKVKLFGAGTSQ